VAEAGCGGYSAIVQRGRTQATFFPRDLDYDVSDTDNRTDRHSELVDDPTLPGAGLARAWLIAATLLPSLLLIAYVAIALAARTGVAGLDLVIMQLLRREGAQLDPIGPQWIESLARDVTGLGSNGILVLVVVLAIALLSFSGRHGPALLIGWASVASYLLNNGIKFAFTRLRPEFLSPTVSTETSSFPSGHAMNASVVYLLLAAIIARELADRRFANTVLATAVLLVWAIGLTRIYLGAHWMSDVLAGWTLGAACALAAWTLARAPRPPT